jgi:G3E family GTPase
MPQPFRSPRRARHRLAWRDGMSLPLTVIGGFLGAGKTSLVNHLLATATRRYGVLVNDFGAVNVDAALIAARDGAMLALANGCVCCSLGEELGDGLARLAARTPAPEHVIVEASGVSDPWRIAQLALIEPGFTLEPLIVLADAAAVLGQLSDRWLADTVERQLAFAELIVLNKTDLAADLAAVETRLRAIRPEARLVRTTHGKLDEALLHFAPPPRARLSRFTADAAAHRFPTLSWRPPGPLDPTSLRAALEGLPRAVLRIKGFVQLAPDGAWFLLQYAAERWAFTKRDPPQGPGLVFIGTPDLPDAATLLAPFAAAVA